MKSGETFKKIVNLVGMLCIYFNYIIDFDIDKIYNVSP
jgi:hypothetical protein